MNAARAPRRRFLTRGFTLSAAAAAALALGGSVPRPLERRYVPDTSVEDIVRSGRLVVGVDPSYPPFESYGADPQPRGFDIDLARALAGGMLVELVVRPMGLDGLYDALRSYTIDAAISSIVPTWHAGKDIAFTDAYFNAGLVMCVPPRSTVRRASDLRGRRVGVELGSEADDFFAGAAGRQLGAVVSRFDDVRDALLAVARNEIGAAVTDSPTAALLRRGEREYRVAAPPLTDKPYAVALRAADRALRDAWNRQLASLRERGVLARLASTWL